MSAADDIRLQQDASPVLMAVGSTALLCVRCDFIEEYYGWRCSKCGRFYPNTAPLENWMLNEPYENPDRY